jgi:hypothetical protein
MKSKAPSQNKENKMSISPTFNAIISDKKES